MIWLWITIPTISCFIVFYFKKIPFQYLFIALLPIQMYGFYFFGFTIKPYMVFAFLLLVLMIIKYKKNIFNLLPFRPIIFLFIGIIFLLLFLIDLINGGGLTSINYHIVFLITVICILIFLLSINCDVNKILNFKKSICITAFIFSFLFILYYIFAISGFITDGLIANITVNGSSDYGPIGFYRSGSTITYRLRGFYIDPNAFELMFIFPITFCFWGFFKKRALSEYIFLGFLFLFIIINIIMSKSRLAVILLITIILVNCIFSLFKTKKDKRYFLLFLYAFIVFIALIAALLITKGNLIQLIYSYFSGRASFSDENGRLSIWIDSLETLFKNNPIFGLGQGNIENSYNLESHNTWLEFIVGNGLLVGFLPICYSIWSYVVSIQSYIKECKISHIASLYILEVIISSLGIFIACMFFSYISSPELWLSIFLCFSMSKVIDNNINKNKKNITNYNVYYKITI